MAQKLTIDAMRVLTSKEEQLFIVSYLTINWIGLIILHYVKRLNVSHLRKYKMGNIPIVTRLYLNTVML